jgi:hypothetical protein
LPFQAKAAIALGLGADAVIGDEFAFHTPPVTHLRTTVPRIVTRDKRGMSSGRRAAVTVSSLLTAG